MATVRALAGNAWPTLAAFLQPRYPFRARLRRDALAVVASAATASRRCSVDARRLENVSAADARTGNQSRMRESVARHARDVARALDETVWPALASLLERDHPARRQETAGSSGSNRAASVSAVDTHCTT